MLGKPPPPLADRMLGMAEVDRNLLAGQAVSAPQHDLATCRTATAPPCACAIALPENRALQARAVAPLHSTNRTIEMPRLSDKTHSDAMLVPPLSDTDDPIICKQSPEVPLALAPPESEMGPCGK